MKILWVAILSIYLAGCGVNVAGIKTKQTQNSKNAGSSVKDQTGVDLGEVKQPKGKDRFKINP